MEFPLARQYFYQEIHQPDATIDLAKAALYIALEAYPDLQIEVYLKTLDKMADEVNQRLPPERYPLKVLQTINHYLYDDLGFSGNTNNYYDQRNSFLNEVIDRKTGIPITLSLVYLEIARRINWPMIGIGMPGHFLIRPDFADSGIFVDPFHRGEILFPEDCAMRLEQIYGHPITLRPELLAPVTKKQFLARLLNNLKVIYINQGDLRSALGAIERILLLFPDNIRERRDRGLMYYQLERWTEARLDLESYLEYLPNAEDAGIIQQLLSRLSQTL